LDVVPSGLAGRGSGMKSGEGSLSDAKSSRARSVVAVVAGACAVRVTLDGWMTAEGRFSRLRLAGPSAWRAVELSRGKLGEASDMLSDENAPAGMPP